MCDCMTCAVFVVAQLLLSEEKDAERPDNVEDDEDGHLIYNINDVIRKRCEFAGHCFSFCTGVFRGRWSPKHFSVPK